MTFFTNSKISTYPQETEHYFIRHGESEANIDPRDILGGNYDLTEHGVKQIHTTAQTLRSMVNLKNITVFFSPLRRTARTANIICHTLKMPFQKIICLKSLIEINVGALHEKPRATIQENPRFASDRKHNKRGTAFPEGENYLDVEFRVTRHIERLKAVGNSINITHGGVMRALLCVLEGNKDSYNRKIKNGAILKLTLNSDLNQPPKLEWITETPQP